MKIASVELQGRSCGCPNLCVPSSGSAWPPAACRLPPARRLWFGLRAWNFAKCRGGSEPASTHGCPPARYRAPARCHRACAPAARTAVLWRTGALKIWNEARQNVASSQGTRQGSRYEGNNIQNTCLVPRKTCLFPKNDVHYYWLHYDYINY